MNHISDAKRKLYFFIRDANRKLQFYSFEREQYVKILILCTTILFLEITIYVHLPNFRNTTQAYLETHPRFLQTCKLANFAVNYCCKTFRLRCFYELWIRLWYFNISVYVVLKCISRTHTIFKNKTRHKMTTLIQILKFDS